MTLAKKMYDTENIEVDDLNEMNIRSINEIMKKLSEKKRTRDFALGGIDVANSPFSSFLLGKSDETIKDPDYQFWKDKVKFLPNQLRATYGSIDPMSELLMARRLQSDLRKGMGAIAPGMEIKNLNQSILREMGANVWAQGYNPQDAALFLTTADKQVGQKGNEFSMHYGHRSGISDNKFPRQIFDTSTSGRLVPDPMQFDLHVDDGVLMNSQGNIPTVTHQPNNVYHFSADYLKNNGHVIRPAMIRGKDRRLKLELGPDGWHRMGDHFVDDISMMNANFVPYGEGTIHRSSLIPLKQKVRNNSMKLAKSYLADDENRKKLSTALVGSGLVNPNTVSTVKAGGKALADMAKKKLMEEMPTVADVITSRGKNIKFTDALSTGHKIITEGKQVFDKVKGAGRKISSLFNRFRKKKKPSPAATATTSVDSTPLVPLKRKRRNDDDSTVMSPSTSSSTSVSGPSKKKRRRTIGGNLNNNALLHHLQNFTYF